MTREVSAVFVRVSAMQAALNTRSLTRYWVIVNCQDVNLGDVNLDDVKLARNGDSVWD
jgi:hypothetical protein